MRKSPCKNGIESVKKNVPMAAVEDQTVEVYTTHANCINGVESVKKNAVDAETVEE